jgi:hypothetical protein
MTIRRVDDTVLLEEVCDVEDAETLLQQLQGGGAMPVATQVDWSACTHLHTACLQVLLAARLPVRGTPANPSIARWVAPLLHPGQTISGQN